MSEFTFEQAGPRSSGSFAEFESLPSAQKEDLCRGLLAEWGVTSVHQRDAELIHKCVLPWHNESKPSASLNFEHLVYRCLTADTLVKTFEGERRIGDLAGQTVTLLDGDGKWVEAPVKHYGQDRIYRVTLSRNGVRREVYTTSDHRWYVRPRGDYGQSRLVATTTANLRPKQRIPSVWAMTRTGRTKVSPTGVMAGFVYGDGTQTEHGARAYFYGEKDSALLPFFAAHEVNRSDPDKAVVLTGLPRSWKSLPSLDEGPSYLHGWLAGYFAADGCVAADGHVTLACADADTLRFVVALCDRLGVATYTLGSRTRVGRSGAGEATHASDIHSLSFRSSTLTPDFFLIPEHRARFEQAQRARRYERTHWWVTSVEDTGRVEDVYCAEVSTTSSFVLAGNILTGNCLGCDSKGGFLWLIATVRGTSGVQARDWLAEQTGIGGADFDLGALMTFLDAIYSPRSRSAPPIPKFSQRVLEPWRAIHPWLTTGVPELGIEGRGIPEANVIAMQVGYAPEYVLAADDEGRPLRTSERIVIPHFWKGDLVGWQSRRLYDDGSPKYLSTGDFPRDRTLYNYDPKRRLAVVVESPMSALRHMHHLPIEATFGAAVTDRQVRLLAEHEVVVWWPDNDEAGWKATEGHGDSEGLVRRLEPYCEVRVVESEWAADAAEMDDQIAATLVDEAAPGWLWQRPTALRCWHCNRVHEGACA